MIKKLLMAAAVVVMAVPAAAQGSRRSEVSVSYGVAPVTDWIDSYSDMLTGLFTNANTDLKGWGAVTVGYSFRLIGSLRLGAQVVYSSNTQEVRGAGSEIRNRYWSLLPNVKWNWMNLKVVSFYSRLGAGASLSATNAENQQIAKQTPSFTPKNVKSGVFVLFKIIQPLHNKRVAILKESDEKRLIFIYPFSLIFQDFTSS